MKKLYSLLALLFAAVLMIISCKKEDNTLGVFTCTVDSTTAWSATKETIALHAGQPLNIIGRDDSTTFIITLLDIDDVGTFTINDNSTHTASFQDGAGTFDIYKNKYGSSGTVVITALSETNVKGTFNLHLSNSFVMRHFTTGSFDININQ